MQTCAQTTLAVACDFWTLRYTTTLEDGSLVVCERSLTSSIGGPIRSPSTSFVRAEMLPSGFLVRPCEGGGSIIHIADHVDLDVSECLINFYTSHFSLCSCLITLIYIFYFSLNFSSSVWLMDLKFVFFFSSHELCT